MFSNQCLLSCLMLYIVIIECKGLDRRLLSEAKRNQAIGMQQNSAPQVDAANLFNVNQNIVSSQYQRFRDTGTVYYRLRERSPRVTSIHEDKFISKRS